LDRNVSDTQKSLCRIVILINIYTINKSQSVEFSVAEIVLLNITLSTVASCDFGSMEDSDQFEGNDSGQFECIGKRIRFCVINYLFLVDLSKYQKLFNYLIYTPKRRIIIIISNRRGIIVSCHCAFTYVI